MASVNISSMNSTNNCGVASILKKPAPQAVEATLLPAATQMFEVLSSTLAIAKIQPVPAEDPDGPPPLGARKNGGARAAEGGGGMGTRLGGGTAAALRADMEMVRDVLGPSRSAPSACFGLGREAAGSIFKKDPEFETFVESMVQVLTVSEADGINRAGIRGANDVLLGVKAGLWGSDATNTASNVFPGFIVARKQRGDDRVVGRTAFVKIPRSTVTLPKESVAALMELVETRMQADKLVIVVERLEDDEALRKAWVRAFTMIGFEMVSAAAMPHNSDKYMLLGCEF